MNRHEGAGQPTGERLGAMAGRLTELVSQARQSVRLFGRGSARKRPPALVSVSILTSLCNLGAMGLGFAISVVLSRSLGTRGYGAYVYALAWPTLLVIPAQLGYAHLVVRHVAAYSAQRDWGLVRGIIARSQRVVLAMSVAVTSVAVLVGWAFVGRGQPLVRQSYFAALLLIPICALVHLREAVLRGFHRAALGRLPEAIVQPALLLILLTASQLLFPGWLSSPTATGMAVVTWLVALGLGSWLSARSIPECVQEAPVRYEGELWFRSARSLFIIGGVTVLNLQIGVLLLGAIKDVDTTAVFSAALRLASLVGFLQAAIVGPLAPAIARLYANAEHAKLQRLVSLGALGALACSTPLALALVLQGNRALGLFGSEFRVGTVALSLLVAGELVNVACGFVAVILINTGHESALLRVGAVIAASSLLLNLVLIPIFGLEGAALARSSILVAQNVALAVIVWRKLGIYSPAFGRNALVGMGKLDRPPTSEGGEAGSQDVRR